MSRRSKGSAASADHDAIHSGHAGGSLRPLAVLGMAIILWLPSGRALAGGDLELTTAAVRFLVAVGVCWAGLSIVAFIVRGYATPAQPAPPPPKRRRTDQVRTPSVSAPIEAVEMHPERDGDDAIIDVITEDA